MSLGRSRKNGESQQTGPRLRRLGREVVEFSVKGPVSVSLDEDQVTSPGCSVIDLLFPASSQVGELVFRNYYTSRVTVLVRYGNGLQAVSGSSKASEDTGPWLIAVPHRILMPNPHLETGSHDLFSIPATEKCVPCFIVLDRPAFVAVRSFLFSHEYHLPFSCRSVCTQIQSVQEWSNLAAMRLVLRQPSPMWRTFHVEELNVYRDLPRRVPRPIQHMNLTGSPLHCQDYNSLLALVRRQTVQVLKWMPGSETNPPRENHNGSGYEIFNLPQA